MLYRHGHASSSPGTVFRAGRAAPAFARLAGVGVPSMLAPASVVVVHKEVVSMRKHSRYAAAES